MGEKKIRILVAEDDPQLLRLFARNLEFEGYAVLPISDGGQVLEHIKAEVPDLVLLDVMMSKLDSFTICQCVREFSSVPIIIVTLGEQDKIRSVDCGADDYLTKPFGVDELLTRVQAVLRRAHVRSNGYMMGTVVTFGALTIDNVQHQVTMAGKEVVLTPTEYHLLCSLASNPGRIMTHDQLLEHVWGRAYVDEHHLLQLHADRLRQKLEPDAAQPSYILTKPGIGYLLPMRCELAGAN
jgi:DNA-binding response OmpR family regulator